MKKVKNKKKHTNITMHIVLVIVGISIVIIPIRTHNETFMQWVEEYSLPDNEYYNASLFEQAQMLYSFRSSYHGHRGFGYVNETGNLIYWNPNRQNKQIQLGNRQFIVYESSNYPARQESYAYIYTLEASIQNVPAVENEHAIEILDEQRKTDQIEFSNFLSGTKIPVFGAMFFRNEGLFVISSGSNSLTKYMSDGTKQWHYAYIGIITDVQYMKPYTMVSISDGTQEIIHDDGTISFIIPSYNEAQYNIAYTAHMNSIYTLMTIQGLNPQRLQLYKYKFSYNADKKLVDTWILHNEWVLKKQLRTNTQLYFMDNYPYLWIQYEEKMLVLNYDIVAQKNIAIDYSLVHMSKEVLAQKIVSFVTHAGSTSKKSNWLMSYVDGTVFNKIRINDDLVYVVQSASHNRIMMVYHNVVHILQLYEDLQ